MSLPDALQTIAEISIAFAGFSGLIVAFRRDRGPLTNVEKYRLRVLLTLAFGAMFLSFLPQLLLLFGIPDQRIWQFSAAGLGLYSGFFVFWWLSASREIMRQVPEIFHWFAFSRMAAGHIIVIGLQAGVVLMLIESRAVAIYLIGLVWYLLHAAQQFVRMLFVQPRMSED